MVMTLYFLIVIEYKEYILEVYIYYVNYIMQLY